LIYVNVLIENPLYNKSIGNKGEVYCDNS